MIKTFAANLNRFARRPIGSPTPDSTTSSKQETAASADSPPSGMRINPGEIRGDGIDNDNNGIIDDYYY